MFFIAKNSTKSDSPKTGATSEKPQVKAPAEKPAKKADKSVKKDVKPSKPGKKEKK
ncbi:MAG: hypothetical protein PHG79_01995 [Methanosarcina sp.]|nr:hypothetical protein [Methanosarcina sp.]MDD3874728.1 hypothetical protein [Methanosarcina sp.]MDD4521787.1 hypothetical protein [Methanosarcina sp.]HHV24591.1 hypothetical protein [Methanosarcina sp.]